MKFVDQDENRGFSPEVLGPPNLREIHTRYGFTIKLERRDPYGFVHVVWHKGAVPKELEGAYSSFDMARAAVNRYMENNTFNYEVAEKLPKPEIKFKNVKQ